MKTNLNIEIRSQEDAEAFLVALNDNGEAFHPEDDAHDVLWSRMDIPSKDDLDRLNELMEACFAFCDPCEILLNQIYKNA